MLLYYVTVDGRRALVSNREDWADKAPTSHSK